MHSIINRHFLFQIKAILKTIIFKSLEIIKKNLYNSVLTYQQIHCLCITIMKMLTLFDFHGTVHRDIFHGTVHRDIFHGTVHRDIFHGIVHRDIFHGTVHRDIFLGTVHRDIFLW
jgi:hypothetical protein